MSSSGDHMAAGEQSLARVQHFVTHEASYADNLLLFRHLWDFLLEEDNDDQDHADRTERTTGIAVYVLERLGARSEDEQVMFELHGVPYAFGEPHTPAGKSLAEKRRSLKIPDRLHVSPNQQVPLSHKWSTVHVVTNQFEALGNQYKGANLMKQKPSGILLSTLMNYMFSSVSLQALRRRFEACVNTPHLHPPTADNLLPTSINSFVTKYIEYANSERNMQIASADSHIKMYLLGLEFKSIEQILSDKGQPEYESVQLWIAKHYRRTAGDRDSTCFNRAFISAVCNKGTSPDHWSKMSDDFRSNQVKFLERVKRRANAICCLCDYLGGPGVALLLPSSVSDMLKTISVAEAKTILHDLTQYAPVIKQIGEQLTNNVWQCVAFTGDGPIYNLEDCRANFITMEDFAGYDMLYLTAAAIGDSGELKQGTSHETSDAIEEDVESGEDDEIEEE